MDKTQKFIAKSKVIHGDRYDYSRTVYEKAKIGVKIVCHVHGEFEQKPYHHLQGSGCSLCASNNYSKKSIEWLTYMEKVDNCIIQHALNGGEYLIPGTRYKVDGFVGKNNVVYEFYGDCWHGNPKIFAKYDRCQPFDDKITAGELYQRTIQRENCIKKMGYVVKHIWESEWDNGR